jgi:hypothetical protein
MMVEAHELALRDAGFRDVTFHNVTLGPDPQAGDEGDSRNQLIYNFVRDIPLTPPHY